MHSMQLQTLLSDEGTHVYNKMVTINHFRECTLPIHTSQIHIMYVNIRNLHVHVIVRCICVYMCSKMSPEPNIASKFV